MKSIRPAALALPPESPIVLTIGHSTRTIEEFIALLQANAVTCVVDVRTVPRSRHNPQFNRETLPVTLKPAGINYVHMAELGGLRHATRDSLNLGWRNASFRGYADYMQTPEFQRAIDQLILLANQDRVVLMCAEAVPWRCHRSLIADALLVRGIRSEDIMNATRRQVHALTPFARVEGTQITYPADASQNLAKKASVNSSPQPGTSGQHRVAKPCADEDQTGMSIASLSTRSTVVAPVRDKDKS